MPRASLASVLFLGSIGRAGGLGCVLFVGALGFVAGCGETAAGDDGAAAAPDLAMEPVLDAAGGGRAGAGPGGPACAGAAPPCDPVTPACVACPGGGGGPAAPPCPAGRRVPGRAPH